MNRTSGSIMMDHSVPLNTLFRSRCRPQAVAALGRRPQGTTPADKGKGSRRKKEDEHEKQEEKRREVTQMVDSE